MAKAKCILVVEDDGDLAQLVADVVEAAGYRQPASLTPRNALHRMRS